MVILSNLVICAQENYRIILSETFCHGSGFVSQLMRLNSTVLLSVTCIVKKLSLSVTIYSDLFVVAWIL